ncbi:MAG: DoxX family protein [Gemmatimonadales bacterium]
MDKIKHYVPLAGRILLALIFVVSSLLKAGAWDQTTGYMAHKGMPLIPLFLAGAIVVELLGGFSILLGFKAKVGATVLFVFLIPVSLIFHNFWALEGVEQQVEMTMFLKNLSIMGGLLLVIGLGTGPLSLDNRIEAVQG